jgi:hypothetical protein
MGSSKCIDNPIAFWQNFDNNWQREKFEVSIRNQQVAQLQPLMPLEFRGYF